MRLFHDIVLGMAGTLAIGLAGSAFDLPGPLSALVGLAWGYYISGRILR
jgi:hypothetical protein